jgi:hypothetical protein
VCCHILLYSDVFGSCCHLAIISGAVSDLDTVVVCGLVVRLQTLVYSVLKVRILAPGFKVFKCIMSVTMCDFPFFPNVFPVLLIFLCFLSVVRGFQILVL